MGCGSVIRKKISPDPDSGVKKVPDLGSGSATLKKKDCVEEENECEGIRNIHPGSGS
jgi:hypothetical protein